MKSSSYLLAIAASVAAGLSSQASTLYGVEFPASTDLFVLDQTTGSSSSVGPTGKDGLGDLTSDTRPGSQKMWSVRIASNELIEIDPTTGTAVAVIPMDSPDNMVSLAFDVVSGKLYGNTSAGFGASFDALYEIDPVTGATTFVGRILFDNVYALGFDQSGQLFGVSDATDDLISIDTTTGNGTFIADLTASLAFDIASRPEDDVMFLADSGTFSLYTLDTGTGALTLVGPYGSTENIVGLAFQNPVPEASTQTAGLALGCALLGEGLRRRRRANG